MRVLSFGAGVQSTAVLLAEHLGMIDPIDLIIFADTGAEPKSVYEWLNFIRYYLKREIEIVSHGDIVADSLSGNRFASAPFYVRNKAGSQGILRRQCTADYKIKPIHNHLRQFKGQPISMLMGISTDECQRAKESRVKWIKHEFPLLWPELKDQGGVLGWRRQQCLEFVEKEIGRRPPRSACYFCPYHSDAEWISLRDREPEAFESAVEFDRNIRGMATIDSEAFLHRSLKPLSEVEFKQTKDPDQLTMLDECEGMCGL